MRRVLVAGVCGMLLLAGCGSSVGAPATSPSSDHSDAYTPAATLRVKLDLVFVEHTATLAKLTFAATAGRRDEFFAYAKVLAGNGSDVSSLFRLAIGETASAAVATAWANGNNYAIDYIVAGATHDDAASQTAIHKLSNDYVTQLSAALAPTLGASPDDISRLVAADVMALKTLVDDTASASLQKSFADLPAAIAASAGFADELARNVAQHYPDRFPGDPDAKAAAARSQLEVGLASQAAYYSMFTQAVVAGAGGEQAGASQAIAANTPSLSAISTAWAQALDPLSAYAKNGDAASRQAVLSAAPSDADAAFTALLVVVDDQRAKAYAKLVTDDPSSAATFASIADEVAAGT